MLISQLSLLAADKQSRISVMGTNFARKRKILSLKSWSNLRFLKLLKWISFVQLQNLLRPLVERTTTEPDRMNVVVVNGNKGKVKGGAEEKKRIFYGPICPLNETNRMKGRRKFEAEIAKRLFYIIASFHLILDSIRCAHHCAHWIQTGHFRRLWSHIRVIVLFPYLDHPDIGSKPPHLLLPNNQFRSCFNQLRKNNRLICI